MVERRGRFGCGRRNTVDNHRRIGSGVNGSWISYDGTHSCSLLIVIEISSYLWGTQQPFDSLGFIKAFIDAKADVRRKFEIHPPGDFPAKVAFVAVQRRKHGCGVLPPERTDISRLHSHTRPPPAPRTPYTLSF